MTRLASRSTLSSRIPHALWAFLAIFAIALPGRALSAQDAGADQTPPSPAEQLLAAREWVQPPAEIADAVLAPRYLNVTLNDRSPDGRWFLREVSDGPVTMDRFSRPFDELGGQFLEPQANRHRRLSIRSSVGVQVISAADGSVTDIEVPDGARVSAAQWSPDGSRIAFYVHFDDATHIQVADPESGDSRQVTRDPVLATMVTNFQWTSGGDEIATVLVPRGSPVPSHGAGHSERPAGEADGKTARTCSGPTRA